MKAFLRQHHKLVFYVSWLIVNLIQAGFTGLLDDEAYYWVYSRFLDWGYFDHPPMIGVLIKLGYGLFANPFGLRLFIVLMSTATLMLIDRMLEKRDDKLFYAIASSMFILQIGGIIAVPDLPLMFFTALYFLVYKKFLQTQNLLNSLLLGLVIALMLYSKYHGILIVFFTLLSNPKLFLRWQTYVAAIFAIALFAPHILWQYNHGFPSVSYHLFERNATAYKTSFSSEYVFGQFALAGPLIGWLLLYAAFNKKPVDQFEKTLRWTTLGVYGVFLLATFKGRVEANWTVCGFIGLIILAHQALIDHKLKKWIYTLLIPSLIITLVLRVYMIADLVPAKWLKKDEFHKTKAWAMAIKDSAKGLPVVFLDSYQRPSQYWFWTGDTTMALNTTNYRRNNYNFWPLEQRLQGKKVFMVYPAGENKDQFALPTIRGNIKSRQLFFNVTDSFYSHSSIRITATKYVHFTSKMFTSSLETYPYHALTADMELFMVLYSRNNEPEYILPARHSWHDSDGESVAVSLDGVKPGKYTYKWAIGTSVKGKPSINSVGNTIAITP
jgi:4-amino-4-deoxy-L-arabinose transferase-like glycosyltransferase